MIQRTGLALAVFAATCVVATAQTTTRPSFIRVYGEGSAQIKPDLAKLQVGVVTEASTANEAATQNTTLAQAVIDALKRQIGATGEVRTVSYSIQPNYVYQANQIPTLKSFTATNIVEATSSDLTGIGRLIDIALQAGANRVQSLSFSLKDDTQARAQALRLAAQNARAKAEVLALGTGVKLGIVLAVQEGYATTPVAYNDARGAGTAATTPVEPGTLDVRATITLDMQITQ